MAKTYTESDARDWQRAMAQKDTQIAALEEQQRNLILQVHAMEVQITDLAVALESTTGRDAGGHPCWCANHAMGHTERCEKRRAPLRRVGRIP